MNKDRPAKALYFTGVGKTEIRREAIQGNKNDIYLESVCMGISHGTEMNIYRGCFQKTESEDAISALEGTMDYPLKYGYINVAVNEAGDPFFAFYPHQDKFFCSPGDIIPLPSDLHKEDAVFLASMETALGIVHDTAPLYGEIVAVFGLGVIGILVCEILKNTGPASFIGIDPLQSRRRLAEELGGRSAAPEEAAETIANLSGGRGADIAINVSSSESAIRTALENLCFEGRLIEASWYGSREVSIPLGGDFHRKRLTITSSQVSHIKTALSKRWDKERRMKTVIELLRKLEPSKYISHRFPLDQSSDAYSLIDKKQDEVMQVVLYPGA
jgi:threonine dehydrogenase-like Zn-dependent dehydrogenase